jgi:tRNA(His) guanylyltransferase
MARKHAQESLMTTNSAEKNELLFSKFGINYNNLDASFRKGSVIYRRLKQTEFSEKGLVGRRKKGTELTVEHCDVIGDEFWSGVGRDLFGKSGVMEDEDKFA